MKKNGTIFLESMSLIPDTIPLDTIPLCIRGLGIDETVAGGNLTFGNIPQYVLMMFHTPGYAVINKVRQDIQPGSLILWSRNISNEYGQLPEVGWSHSWLVFGGIEAEQIMQASEMEFNHIYDCQDFQERFRFLLHELYQEITQTPERDDKMRMLILEILFHSIKRKINTDNPQNIPARFLEAVDYINTHFGNNITLEMLAKQACYSIPRFSALFQSYFKESPMAYLNNRRLQMSAHLLQTTELSIGTIAKRCGFSNALYFSNRFHRYWKVSPSEYRSANRWHE